MSATVTTTAASARATAESRRRLRRPRMRGIPVRSTLAVMSEPPWGDELWRFYTSLASGLITQPGTDMVEAVAGQLARRGRWRGASTDQPADGGPLDWLDAWHCAGRIPRLEVCSAGRTWRPRLR